jgi:hypothetical protein
VLVDHGLDHPRGRLATRRLNQIHRRFAISDDDYRYVLGTFIYVPIRWIDRHGWRPLCCHERAAAFHFYRELGRRMNIRDIPADYETFEAFFDGYERDHIGYTDAAARLMRSTKGLVARLPRPLVPAGRALADALLDPPLRAATGVPQPPRPARATLRATLATRAWLLRRRPPRERRHLADGIRTATYPDGYDLARIGRP